MSNWLDTDSLILFSKERYESYPEILIARLSLGHFLDQWKLVLTITAAKSGTNYYVRK